MNRNCFVLMPFAPAFDGIWETVLRPTVIQHGDTCGRADDVFSQGIVIDDVLKCIKNADYLIADLTGRNPNVYYELGVAHALKKGVILITQQISDIPFDLKSQRVIEYSDTVAGATALRVAIQRYLAYLSP
jgi:hypothetical protein